MKKTGLAIGLGIVGILVIIFSMFWGTRSKEIKMKNGIDTQYASNKSTYDNMWKQLKEMVQISELQTEQVKDIYMGLIEGRYEDENLLFKSITEDNPDIDSSVYTEIQREIAANRKTFNNTQKIMLDKIREYNNYVQTNLMCVMFLHKQPLNENDYIVLSSDTNNAFDSGETDEINLIGNK